MGCEIEKINSFFNFLEYDQTPEERLSQRILECKAKTNEMAKKIYEPNTLSSSIDLWIDWDIVSIPAAFGHKNISIPHLFLLKSADIPERFRIKNLDDPRLQSDLFLQEAANWTYDFFGMQKKQTPTAIEKETIKIFLKYIKDPEKSENAKEFVLAHEIGHLFHNHTHGFILPEIFSLSTLLKITSLIFLFLLSAFLIPTPFSWAIVAVSAIATAIFAISILSKIHHSKSCEKEADLVAANYSGEAKNGGIYLFETLLEAQKRLRNQHIKFRLLFSPHGNNRAFYFTHPSEMKRICYLKAHSKSPKSLSAAR